MRHSSEIPDTASFMPCLAASEPTLRQLYFGFGEEEISDITARVRTSFNLVGTELNRYTMAAGRPRQPGRILGLR